MDLLKYLFYNLIKKIGEINVKNLVIYTVRAFLVCVVLIIILAVFKEEYLGKFMEIVTIVFLVCLTVYMVYMGRYVYGFIRGKNVTDYKTNIDDTKKVKMIATMTGRTNYVDRKGYKTLIYKYTEYEITYNVEGKVYKKWINFSTGVDFCDCFPEGTQVLIYCNRKNPKWFEVIEVL